MSLYELGKQKDGKACSLSEPFGLCLTEEYTIF